MVTAGYAWVYDDYVTDKSFYENQSKARELRKGLWKDLNSIPPWVWRRKKSRN
jgi:endonuclease YncB( thermonuclease family)